MDEAAIVLQLLILELLNNSNSSEDRDTVAIPSKKPRIKAMKRFGAKNSLLR